MTASILRRAKCERTGQWTGPPDVVAPRTAYRLFSPDKPVGSKFFRLSDAFGSFCVAFRAAGFFFPVRPCASPPFVMGCLLKENLNEPFRSR